MISPSRFRLCAFAPLREILLLLLLLLTAAPTLAADPRVLLEGAALEQVACEPDIVTPIGMAFDARGRLLVVESHTHERPDDYPGPKGDRIRRLADSDGDGRLDAWSTFAEGFQNACNLLVRDDGAVYLVTRNDVRLLVDSDDNGVADKDDVLVRLETKANYPHNGLSGVAWDPVTKTLFVALAENFGEPYKLTGSDGRTLAGGAGIGTIFRCDGDGKHLQRWATGFWNIFCMTRTLAGELLAVDNDPDAAPSCRLVHVVRGGDYGFRYTYGRSGLHPLQAWNGELPGTLPMICGTGEAPTAMVVLAGHVWVTSWGDHRVERYALSPEGATFTASRDVVVQGDADFRPTGMAVAPDGSLYFADWVDKSYAVHGKGRIWRLTLPAGTSAPESPPVTAAAKAAESPTSVAEPNWTDPFAVQQAIAAAIGPLDGGLSMQLPLWITGDSPEGRLFGLRVLRFRSLSTPQPVPPPIIRSALRDSNPDIRLYAVRWVADERMQEFRDDVAALLDGELPNQRYYMGVLAALEWLDGDESLRATTLSDGLLARELRNKNRPAKVKALALRLIAPDHKYLTLARMREYLASEDAALRLEAIRTLAQQSNAESFTLLADIANDEHRPSIERCEALVGLAPALNDHLALVEKLADCDDAAIAREAVRVLVLNRKRAVAPEEKPAAEDLAAWERLLGEGGDPESGRRLFFSSVGPRCAACHVVGGRGGRVGPELTAIGRVQPRSRIIASILQPSREIAPQFQSWTLITADGKPHAGLRLPKAGDDGQELYADAAGRQFTLPSDEIEVRELATTSIMPAGLEQTASIVDLRDLLAFLTHEN